MQIAPVHAHEEQRLASLARTNLLDTPHERDFDRLVFTAAQAFRVPIAALTLIEAKRQWFKSAVGVSTAETPRDISFCSHTILETDVTVIEDATRDVRFRDNPFVTGQPHIVFYAGAPVFSADGFPLGSFCVIDRFSRQMTKQQIRLLKQLSGEAQILIQRYSC